MIPCTENNMTYCLICLLRLSKDIEDEIKLGGRCQVGQLLCNGCGYREIGSQYRRNEFKCGHATCMILERCCAGPGQLVRASFVWLSDEKGSCCITLLQESWVILLRTKPVISTR